MDKQEINKLKRIPGLYQLGSFKDNSWDPVVVPVVLFVDKKGNITMKGAIALGEVANK